jgi:hypothetical protein
MVMKHLIINDGVTRSDRNYLWRFQLIFGV